MTHAKYSKIFHYKFSIQIPNQIDSFMVVFYKTKEEALNQFDLKVKLFEEAFKQMNFPAKKIARVINIKTNEIIREQEIRA